MRAATDAPHGHRDRPEVLLTPYKLYVLPSFYRPIIAISSSYTDRPHSYICRLYYVRLRSASVLILHQRFANDDKHSNAGKRIVASWRTKKLGVILLNNYFL